MSAFIWQGREVFRFEGEARYWVATAATAWAWALVQLRFAVWTGVTRDTRPIAELRGYSITSCRYMRGSRRVPTCPEGETSVPARLMALEMSSSDGQRGIRLDTFCRIIMLESAENSDRECHQSNSGNRQVGQ